jgi:arginyl-tRNA--protein-N-Asp/Glu arginylyltransferase
MTEPGIFYPEKLSPGQLDSFLEMGWYRMGQGIFTTHYISHQDNLYQVYWLRYNLKKIFFDKPHQKILNSNRNFTVRFLPLHITSEQEALFTIYKTGIDFDPAETIKHLLLGEAAHNIYDTHVIEVRDHNVLIAAGIFDYGKNSIAGILNFYHPAYKKYSLGKYLMLLKIIHAQAMGKHWYYPGYIVKDFPKFDYKLFAGKSAAELYLQEFSSWHSYLNMNATD